MGPRRTWPARTDVNTLARNPRVDQALSDSQRWRQETERLRDILLECGLTEELKWRQHRYTHDGRNICMVQGMKDFLALLFFKGALLKDPDGVLERQGPNSRADFGCASTALRMSRGWLRASRPLRPRSGGSGKSGTQADHHDTVKGDKEASIQTAMQEHSYLSADLTGRELSGPGV